MNQTEKRLLISKDRHETRAAVLENGLLYEFFLERPGCSTLVGNIYKGRVENVLRGLEAAFVDIGLGRNGYLQASDVLLGKNKSHKTHKISELLRSGQEVLVQVTKDAQGDKGPRLTMHLSLAGRNLVYMPGSSLCGASRRLEKGERERLRAICRALLSNNAGLIIRTAAEGAKQEDLERDIRFLQRVWGGVRKKVETVSAPALLYRELELPLRVVRDFFSPDFSEVVVDDEAVGRRLRNYMHCVLPELAGRITLHTGVRPLFAEHRVEEAIKQLFARRVELPSGGYIIIEHTEAMTVIDVNTGSFTGKKLFEDTSTRTNLEAAREIVRQLRLRDIGGIIIIDFIDMNISSNQEAVLATLKAEFAKDRTKTYVVELSTLGLVEMTRQNTTESSSEIMTTTCPVCRGEGRVLSDDSALIAVERRLKEIATQADTPGVRAEVHPHILDLLTTHHPKRMSLLQKETNHFFLLEPAPGKVDLDYVALAPD